MRLLYWLCQKLVGRTDLISQFQRYRTTVLWLYKTLFLTDKRSFLLALTTNVVGVTLQGGALSLLILYASRMEAGADLTWGQYRLATRDPQTFLAVIAVLAILLLLSAAVVFLGNRIIARTALGYAAHSSRRTLGGGGVRPPRDPDPSRNPVPDQIVSQAASLVAVARAVRPLLQVSKPAAMFVYSLAVVVYIDPWMTLFLLLLVTPTLFLQYVVNFRAAQNQERLGEAGQRARRALAELLQGMSLAPRLHDSQRERLKQEYEQPRIREFGERFAFRIMAASYSTLISDVVTAVAAGILTAYLGLQALSGELGWSLFLGYLIFARLLLQSLRGAMAAITSFARHYPRVRRLYELLSSSPAPVPFTAGTLRLAGRGKSPVGDRKSANMKRGEPVATVSRVPVSRFNAYAFVDALIGKRSPRNSDLRASCFWVPNALESSPGGSLEELLGRGDGAKACEVRDVLERLGFGNWDPSGFLEGPLDQSRWMLIPVQLRAHMLLSTARLNQADLILLEEEVLARAKSDFLSDWWQAMSGRFLVIRYEKPGSVGAFGEKVAMGLASDRSVSLMSINWCRAHSTEVNAWLKVRKGGQAGSAAEEESGD